MLKKKGLYTIQDLINFLPKKFLDTRTIYDVSTIYKLLESKSLLLQEQIGITKTITGIIISKKLFTTPRKKIKILELVVKDVRTQDKLIIKYFNQSYLNNFFQESKQYVFFGKIVKMNATLYMTNPQYEEYSNSMQKFGKIIPIYITTSKYITNAKLRKILYQTIEIIKQLHEYIPHKYLKEYHMLDIPNAYINLHFPQTPKMITQALTRLQIQEILELLYNNELQALHTFNNYKLPTINIKNTFINQLITKFEEFLSIQLSTDQHNAIIEILNAFHRKQSNIFLYGDVGSGKTFVFLLITLLLIQKDYNVILLAPTKILAQQHFHTAQKIFKHFGLGTHVKLVIDKIQISEKNTLYIGTTAVLNKLHIQNVALVAIDEEQKFGVTHKLQLLTKFSSRNITPFFLTISATPIPRTLAQTFYGFNTAIYIQNTPFSKRITTKVTQLQKLSEVLVWLKNMLQNNHQAYIVFPRIDSESYELTIQNLANIFIKQLAPYKVEILHGRLPSKKQLDITKRFQNKETQVLLSTSLVEVGIDNPDVSIMIILGAEMFGLAQLHQLRGRIGRKGQQSYCILIPNSNIPEETIQKLEKFSKITNGLQLAELDLKNRGPGQIIGGLEQTGWNKFKIVNPQDFYIIKKAIRLYKQLRKDNIKILNFINVD